MKYKKFATCLWQYMLCFTFAVILVVLFIYVYTKTGSLIHGIMIGTVIVGLTQFLWDMSYSSVEKEE